MFCSRRFLAVLWGQTIQENFSKKKRKVERLHNCGNTTEKGLFSFFTFFFFFFFENDFNHIKTTHRSASLIGLQNGIGKSNAKRGEKKKRKLVTTVNFFSSPKMTRFWYCIDIFFFCFRWHNAILEVSVRYQFYFFFLFFSFSPSFPHAPQIFFFVYFFLLRSGVAGQVGEDGGRKIEVSTKFFFESGCRHNNGIRSPS